VAHQEVEQATVEPATSPTAATTAGFEDGDRVITATGRYGTVETDADDGLFVSWLDGGTPTPVDDHLSRASEANFRSEQRRLRWLT